MLKKTILIMSVFLSIALYFYSFNMGSESAYALGTGDWHKGISVIPSNTTDFASNNFKQSVSNIKAIGGNYVTLIIPYSQDSIYSTTFHNAYNTPTDDSLIQGINYIHSLGMHVMLKPHVDPDQWRALINPADYNAWFNSLNNMLMHMANIASSTSVEMICIGTEYGTMTLPQYTPNWTNIINNIRSAYKGKLTYSANWGTEGLLINDEKNHIGFWNQLDYIGISEYEPLTNYGDASVNDIVNAWNNILPGIQNLHNKYAKDVIFTEMGYRSVYGANTSPWNYNLSGGYDPTEQVNDYTAYFTFWKNYPWMEGQDIWYWSTNPNAGGIGNTDYLVQNKPAQNTISQFFNSGVISTPGKPSVQISNTSLNPSNPQVNQTTSFNFNVNIAINPLNAGIVDAEVYDSSNRQVIQKFFTGQNINVGGTANYSFSFTPNVQGAYKLSIGVFDSTWNTNYYWNSDSIDFSVSSSGGVNSSGGINLWWPVDGGTYTGVQPFKAVVVGMNISDYIMYWQVDDGQANVMQNSMQDYPHKESIVDLSGWKWKGTGPYKLTFTAKSNQGQLITQKSIMINA